MKYLRPFLAWALSTSVLRWATSATERDAYFWLGLGLGWVGIGGWFSRSIATAAIGAVLVAVAVFGIKPTTGKL